MKLSIEQTLIATFCIALVLFLFRLFPFALFSKKNPPKIIRIIAKYLPSLIIAILLAYCFKDVAFTQSPYGIPYIASIILAVILHLTINNSMISIFGSTILFMILSRIL